MTVVDITSTLSGPYCSSLLAQLGVSVVKVEPPQGDVIRAAGDIRRSGLGPTFLTVTRGKQSIVLDLKSTPGRDAPDKLIDRSDVFLHNMRPDAMLQLGIDPVTVLARNRPSSTAAPLATGRPGPTATSPPTTTWFKG